MRKLGAVVACLTVLCLWGPARGEGKDELEARTLFREGNRRLEQQDYKAALELFRAAYARFASEKILLNIGTTLRLMGRDAEAAEAYDRYLADPKADSKRKAEVSQILAELGKRLGKLRIEVSEPGARVSLDGRPVGESPAPIVVRAEAGPHTVTVEKPGFPLAAVKVTVVAGEEHPVSVKLTRPEGEGGGPAAGGGGEGTGAGPTTITRRPRRAPAEGRGRWGALLRTDVDGKGRGAVAVVGALVGLGDHIELQLSALLGRHQGIYAGGSYAFLRTAWRPVVAVGVPLFFVEKAAPGLHAAAGVEWIAKRWLSFFVLAGVEYYPTLSSAWDKVLFVPTAGVTGRL